MRGKYIYGLIKGNDKMRFSSRGLHNKKPYTIHYNDISAIITDASIKTYEADQEGLLSHNRVLDEVIKAQSVLPMRFGTIARTIDEVKGLIKNAYSILLDKLSKIKDKVEFDLTVTITNEREILNGILEKNNEIRGLRDKLVSQGKGVQIQDKLLIGKMIVVEVAKYKESILKDIIKTLGFFSSQYKLLAGKDIMANIAFLVPKVKTKEFEAKIYKLGEKYGDILKFKYAGPLAPYNFVEMKLILINFNTVDTARRQLGLGETASFNDIKKIYRKLAQEFHPDWNPGDKVKEEEFKRIAGSYKLLCEYCRHYPKKQYIFKSDQINEFSILVESE